MGKVAADISMSLDGFITGPNDDVERLHEWVYDHASWRVARRIATPRSSNAFTFVTAGPASALAQARAAAGDKDVSVAGGAAIIQEFLRAGLLDEIQVHLVPILLGDGWRLFEHLDADKVPLEQTRAVASSDVTHLQYRVVR